MAKIHIVSGFLGAGKTTFIKRLLENISGKKAVIENEFGEVGIDGDILSKENYNVVELAQGCICCSMKTDFEQAILSIIKDYDPEHIIIEPTGIGLLSQVLDILNLQKIKDKCICMSPITIVDVVDYFEQLENFGEFFTDQIANAGVILLSKIDGFDDKEIDNVASSIRDINKNADIVSKNWDELDEVDYNFIIHEMIGESKEIIHISNDIHEISKGIESISIKNPKNFDMQGLELMLKELSDDGYGSIVRIKGFVDGSDGSLMFNFVNKRYEISENQFLNPEKICIIGKNLDKEKIRKLLI